MNSNARVQCRRLGLTVFPLLALVWLLVAVVYHRSPAPEPIMAKGEPVRDALGAVPVRITVLHAAPPLTELPKRVVKKRAARIRKPVTEPKEVSDKGRFIVRGRIFDLATLAPVSGATVRFKDGDTERMALVTTDAKGRYKISLKSNGTGYALSIRHPRYSRRVLEDWGVSFRDMSPAQREQAAADYLSRQLNTIILSMPGQVIEQDYAVLPLRRATLD
ncbi:MAG: carboxypeptidase-like regulatory domain-containing protein [Elusimicrobiota bacterium]